MSIPAMPLVKHERTCFILAAIITAWTVCTTAIGIYNGFFAGANDFWGNYFVAAHLDLSNPESLYNSFFPYGYHFLLRLISKFSDPATSGYIVNIFFGASLLAAIGVLTNRIFGSAAAVVAIVVAALYPRMFHYMHTSGSDIPSVAFFAFGVLFLFYQSQRTDKQSKLHTYLPYAISRLFFGAAASMRYHLLIGAALLFMSFAFCVIFQKQINRIVNKNSPVNELSVFELSITETIAGLVIFALCLFAVYSPQLIINHLTGHGLFETGHALNVYNLMYGINFYHLSDLKIPKDITTVIAQDPILFVKAYSFWFTQLFLWTAFPLVVFILEKKPAIRFFSATAVLFLTLYAALFGISASIRAVLIPITVAVPFAGFLALWVFEFAKSHKRSRLLLLSSGIIVGIATGLFCVKNAKTFSKRHTDSAVYASLENFLIGQGVRSGHQVFATDFYLFFKKIPPFRPNYNGGWGRLGTFAYTEEIQELDMSTISAFAESATKNKITFCILSSEAIKVSSALDSLYTTTVVDTRFTPLFFAGEFRVFSVGTR